MKDPILIVSAAMLTLVFTVCVIYLAKKIEVIVDNSVQKF